MLNNDTHCITDDQIPKLNLKAEHLSFFFYSRHSVPGTLIEDQLIQTNLMLVLTYL